MDQYKQSPLKIAFSYARVSSGNQAREGKKGLARQHEEFEPFCKRHGLTPNPNPVRDEGLSAYHAQHLKKNGALAGFLKAAEEKEIPWGSVLVVEDWSRFSRRKASYSQEMLQQLWNLGCALAWVREDVVITRERFDEDQALRIKLDLAMQAAHDFSRGLAVTGTQVWDLREKEFFESGIKYLSMASAPDWVRINDEKTDFVENERAEWMRDIFKLRVEGKGSKQIAFAMNDLGRQLSEGGNFSEGRVGRILRDRRLLGEKAFKSGRVAKNYFPRFIDNKLWHKVQRLMDAKSGGTGRGDEVNNILQGMTRCTCGGTLSWQGCHRDKETGLYRYHYLVCQNKKNGTCTAPKGNWSYDEELLLHALMNQRWEDFFVEPADTKKLSELQNRLRKEEQAIDDQKDKESTIQENIEKTMALPGCNPADVLVMTRALESAEKRRAESEKVAAAISNEIEVLSLAPSIDQMKKEVKIRTNAFLANLGDPEERRNFNNWINTFPITVELEHKTGQMRFKKSDGGVEKLDVYREGKTIVLDQTRHDAELFGVSPISTKSPR